MTHLVMHRFIHKFIHKAGVLTRDDAGRPGR